MGPSTLSVMAGCKRWFVMSPLIFIISNEIYMLGETVKVKVLIIMLFWYYPFVPYFDKREIRPGS